MPRPKNPGRKFYGQKITESDKILYRNCRTMMSDVQMFYSIGPPMMRQAKKERNTFCARAAVAALNMF